MLQRDFHVDCIIPMTHQLIGRDRMLAENCLAGSYPFILGGHDHEVFLETVNGNTIIKAGNPVLLPQLQLQPPIPTPIQPQPRL